MDLQWKRDMRQGVVTCLCLSPFGSGAADVGNATPTFCFSEPAISKLTTLTGFLEPWNPVSVVSFDIAGSLKHKVGVALPTSAAPLPKGDLTSRGSLEVLAADSVGR